MTRQVVQLGLLPRLDIKRTSETQSGQIYVPAANMMMMIGVLLLLVVFQSSHHLASAYGVAVTGTMFISTLLAYVVARYMWKWSVARLILLLGPISIMDAAFLGSNLFKIPEGGWVPLAFGARAGAGDVDLVARSADPVRQDPRRERAAGATSPRRWRNRPPYRQRGTAMFLTANPDVAPIALMHNLKHNKVLHERNVILTIQTAETPTV